MFYYSLYENLTKTRPCKYTEKFFGCKNENFDIFLIFAQNIHRGFTLELPRRGGSNEYPNCLCEAVLMSTHNVYFGSKIRKSGLPLQTPVFLHKSGI